MMYNIDKHKWQGIVIYLCMIFFFMLQMDFYQQRVGRFPDESSHIAYIAYLEQENRIIPDFGEMPLQVLIEEGKSEQYQEIIFTQDGTNYLGHPPLYYNLMRLSKGIMEKDGGVLINIQLLRDTSQVIALMGIVVAFYIGLTRFNRNIIHLVYGMVITSVPMMAYTSAGINNDSLGFLGASIVLLALIRFTENRREFLTYIILCLGVCISVLAKLTSGLIICIGCSIFFIYIMIKEKSLKVILNKKFFITLPIYLTVVGYFVYLLSAYGTVQPNLQGLDPEFFKRSVFYIAEENRVHMTMQQYIRHFFGGFLNTWTGIASHVSLYREGPLWGVNRIGIILILIIPLWGWVRINTKRIPGMVMYTGILGAIVYQFLSQYNAFLTRGYTGGYQSRYYLCGLAAVAFVICNMMDERMTFWKEQNEGSLYKRNICIIGALMGLLYTGLLVYENFIYFLINFNNYL